MLNLTRTYRNPPEATLYMWRILVLSLWLIVFASRTSGQGRPSFMGNDCQKNIGGTTVYYACVSDPQQVLRESNTNFNLTVQPEAYTCGNPREKYCTLVS